MILQIMDKRDPNYVPDGWIKTIKNNRVTYKSPPPRVVIQGKSMLKDYQRKGRFCDVDADKLDFRQEKAKNNDIESEGTEGLDEMEVDCDTQFITSKVKEKTSAELQKEKVETGTIRLEYDLENPVDHKHELDNAAGVLSQLLADSSNLEISLDLEKLKEDLSQSTSKEHFMEILKNNQEIYDYFSVLVEAKSLSEMLSLPLESSSALVGWPSNVKENIFSKIIKIASREAPQVLSFLSNLILPKDKPIEHIDVIRLADIFGTLAHTTSKKQNGLAKLKSVVLQKEGLGTEGLDRLARLKGVECSSTLSSGRHLLVELGESSFRARVKQGKSFAITCDNLNLKKQNMTQSVIHIEPRDTHTFSDVPKDPKLIPHRFETSNFLLSSPQNSDMLRHLKNVVGTRVGNVLGRNADEASKLKKFLPAFHKHTGTRKNKVPSEVFIPPPDYLNETDNHEFFQFCMKKQGEFLDAVSESVEDKEAFLTDLALVKCSNVIETGTLESEDEVVAREEAEQRVHKQVEKFGRWIGYGDALTYKQFWLGAKALAQGNCTAYERLDYLAHFRLALFHAKMNKTYMDFPVMMPRRAMLEDEGTVPELVALSGIQGISIDEKKIGNNYEKHDQLLMCVGHLYVTNMFKNYLKEAPSAYDEIGDEQSAVEFVLKMLDHYDVEYYFDPDHVKPLERKWDDPANYARDLVSRMILAEVFDAGEEEEDALLLRSLRINLTVYFLNRKVRQDSKYAAYLLLDEVLEQQASERDVERMNQTICVNPSGKRGGGLFT